MGNHFLYFLKKEREREKGRKAGKERFASLVEIPAENALIRLNQTVALKTSERKNRLLSLNST
jgi:hypothetical protein